MPVFLAPIVGFFLKRPWAIALAALVVFCGYLGVRLFVVSAQRDAVRAELAAVSVLVEEQNAKVSEWQKRASLQAARAIAAKKAAARARVETMDRARKILAQPVPASCPEAVSWGARAGIELGQSWEGGR